jgi:TonB-linked SusC/RagA family outer membrane protein
LKNRQIIIVVRIFLLAIVFCLQALISHAQDIISGHVTDRDEKLPLYPVSVVVKGSNKGTVTDSTGYFHIVAKKGSTLIFSFVGFNSTEIQIGDVRDLQITMSGRIADLNEVVMTGYSYQKVKEITGSVSIVKSNELTEVPTGQVESMLQGKVSGLTVINSGMPGASSNVRINGIGNFGNTTPLYIIDGVEGDINNLNPDDIESLQVLKDAGAYAIYGVRGGNGVIIVTTRTGKNGKTRIRYNGYYNRTVPLAKAIDLLNPSEQGEATWEAYNNSGQFGPMGYPTDPIYGSGQQPVMPYYLIAGPYSGLPENDPRGSDTAYNIDYSKGPIYQIVRADQQGNNWYKDVFQPANTQNHTISVSGGNDKNRYLFSVGYLDQQGTLLNTYLKRFTIRTNTEFALNNSIRLGENIQLSYRDNPQIVNNQNFITTTNINDIALGIATNPIIPVFDIKGGWAGLNTTNPLNNPVANRTIAKDNSSENTNVLGNIYAEVKFLKYFSVKTSFGGTYTDYYTYNYNYSYATTINGLPLNDLTENSGYARSWTWTNTLNFSKTFNDVHSIKLLFGTETLNDYYRNQTGTTTGFYTNDPNYRLLSNGASPTPTVSSTASKTVLYSLISRLDYGFKEKLFVSATLRRDGASVFGDENRYAWFPSVSAAWRMSQENFMRDLDWLNELKIRGSWGQSGYYGNTSPFNQYTLYGGSPPTSYYDLRGTGTSSLQGIRPVTIGDNKTGWQDDVMTDFGLESILWKGKLSLTADWYTRRSNGLLFQVALPQVLGAASPPYENIGSVQNTGFNVSLGSKGNFSSAWSWNTTLTYSSYVSKVLSLPDLHYFDDNVYTRNEVGYPVGSFYGLKILGLFKDASDVAKSPAQQDAGPGRFKFYDANGDGKIEADSDRIHFGNPNPKFTLGINIGLRFKGFDFSMFCYGSFGNQVMNTPIFITDIFHGSGAPLSKNALYNSWRPTHMNTKVPLLESIENFSNNADPLGFSGPDSYGLEDGSYFRNKSMELGYTLPASFLSKYRIENFRIYVQALNLFTITSYTGLDPELSGTSSSFGVDWGNYPSNQKQYIIGVSLGF